MMVKNMNLLVSHLLCFGNIDKYNLYVIYVKGHWQQKISTFYIKVFDLNRQNIVVWRYENARTKF